MSVCAVSVVFLSVSAFASDQKDALLVRSVLRQVEKTATEYEELEEFGKKLLTQSSVVLDLLDISRPILVRTARNTDKDWKVRYWSVDMLGYIGTQKSVRTLQKILLNENEMGPVRARSIDSIIEIHRRLGTKQKVIRSDLREFENKIQNAVIKQKLASAITALKPAEKTPKKSKRKKRKLQSPSPAP